MNNFNTVSLFDIKFRHKKKVREKEREKKEEKLHAVIGIKGHSRKAVTSVKLQKRVMFLLSFALKQMYFCREKV